MLTHVTIVVKDQNVAPEFYTKKMGFEKKAHYTNPGQSRWLTVGPKGQAIEMVLWQAGASSDPRLPASHEMPGIGTRWVLEVDDVRKMFAEPKAKSVKFKDAQPLERGVLPPTSSTQTATFSPFTRRANFPAPLIGLKQARKHSGPTTKRQAERPASGSHRLSNMLIRTSMSQRWMQTFFGTRVPIFSTVRLGYAIIVVLTERP